MEKSYFKCEECGNNKPCLIAGWLEYPLYCTVDKETDADWQEITKKEFDNENQ